MLNSSSSMSRGDPWFEDGNIILVPRESEDSETNPVGFKVHRGVLARHSEVFQGMFELPQPDATFDGVTRFEGCQVISMYDIPIELSNLVKALYDGASFQNRSINDFFYLAGILRLSTKYFIGHLRIQAIKYLTRTWTYELSGHDEMLDLAIRTPIQDKLSYPFVHPIHVLNLARETHVRIVVPSCMYFLSLYPLADLLKAEHPKMRVEHPSKPSSTLEPPDLITYTLMFQRRIDVIHDFVKMCGNHQPAPTCTRTCGRQFSRLGTRLATSWVVRTGPFNFIQQATEHVTQDEAFCMACREEFRRDANAFRQKFWKELPSVSGVPSWEVMIEDELSS